MKKLLLPLLFAASFSAASDYNYEITPVVGSIITAGDNPLDTQFAAGAEFQFNNIFETIKPELSFLYTPGAEYIGTDYDTDVYRFGLNGVYEVQNSDKFAVPFFKGGVGYEYVDTEMYDSDSNVYFDLGGGMKINFTEQIALKLEALYMLKNDDSSWNSNIALLAGVVFRFGEKAQKVPDQATTTSDDEAEAARKAAEEAEAKRAAEEARKAEEARRAAAAASAAAAAAAAVDSDGDGVADQKDSCDNTGFDVEVDIHGCPLEIKQAIAEFKFNSAVIDQSKKGNIKELVTFLKNNPSYRVSINGHADDIGSDKNNMIISEKRAEAGKELLVENGIDESRITTIGNGRMEPAVKAETEEARAANRRIEFTLYQ